MAETPQQLGRYTAACGRERVAPYDPDDLRTRLWLHAYDRALANIKDGRDPDGHPGTFGRLCARDVRLVCNCCDNCRPECPHETYPPPRGLLGRLRAWVKARL